MGVYSIGTEALLAVSAEIAALARFRHLRRDPMFTEMFRASPPRLNFGGDCFRTDPQKCEDFDRCSGNRLCHCGTVKLVGGS